MSERYQPGPTPHGHAFDEAASAMQKAVRRCDEEGAVYWALQLEASTPWYAWFRLKVIASEDVGLAGGIALPATLQALHQSYVEAGKRRGGDGRIFLAHAAMLLARAKKSRIVGHCLMAVEGDPREVPDVALDKHCARGRAMGRTIEHFWAESSWLADPETGELTAEGSIPDPYRERAIEALKTS